MPIDHSRPSPAAQLSLCFLPTVMTLRHSEERSPNSGTTAWYAALTSNASPLMITLTAMLSNSHAALSTKQNSLIEALCATPNEWSLKFLMDIVRSKDRGWFRSTHNTLVKNFAITFLELHSDPQSEEMLRQLAAIESELAVEAGCVLIRRLPGKHGIWRTPIEELHQEHQLGNTELFFW